MKTRSLLFLFIAVLLSSCDYMTYIEIINETNDELTVYWLKKADGDSITTNSFKLPDSEGKQEFSIYHGMNNFWTDKEIQTFIKDIYEVKVVSVRRTIILNQDQLYKYLREYRKGRMLQKIEIRLSE
ncbi:MAG: transposase [Bacteroidales bacterium]|nr:transposase [Bacteroidales bacterium]